MGLLIKDYRFEGAIHEAQPPYAGLLARTPNQPSMHLLGEMSDVSGGAWVQRKDGIHCAANPSGNTALPICVIQSSDNFNDKLQNQCNEIEFTPANEGSFIFVANRVVGANSGATPQCYCAMVRNDNIWAWRWNGTGTFANLASQAHGQTFNGSTRYRVRCTTTGTSPTTVKAELFSLDGNGVPTLVATASGTDSTAALQVATGTAGFGSNIDNICTGWKVHRFTRYLVPTSNDAGWLRFDPSYSSDATLRFLGTGPDGATGPFNTTLQVSSTGPSSGFSNTSSTANSVNPGIPKQYTYTAGAAGTRYWFRLSSTDTASSGTVNSNVIGPIVFGVPNQNWCMIADSHDDRPVFYRIESESDIFLEDIIGWELERLYGDRKITFPTRISDGGKKVSDYLTGGDMAATLNSALSSGAVTHCVIQLGINDARNSVTAAQYKTNLQALITQIRANAPGGAATVIYINYPPIVHESAGVGALQLEYYTAIDQLIASESTYVRHGAKWNHAYGVARFIHDADTQYLHFDGPGTFASGVRTAAAIWRADTNIVEGVRAGGGGRGGMGLGL